MINHVLFIVGNMTVPRRLGHFSLAKRTRTIKIRAGLWHSPGMSLRIRGELNSVLPTRKRNENVALKARNAT